MRTAISVPTWQATSKARPNLSPSKPKNSRARIRWAELDTGRNSVSPCTTPRIAAWREIGMCKLEVRSLKSDGADSSDFRLQTSNFHVSGSPHLSLGLLSALRLLRRRRRRHGRRMRGGPCRRAAAPEADDRRRDEHARVGAGDDADHHREREA